MTATAHDFRLYHSNALDLLAELLADELRKPAPGQSLLTPDTLLIPQVAMRRWLQATLAQRHGIAANLEFLTPGEFVARALDANGVLQPVHRTRGTAIDREPYSVPAWRLRHAR